MDPDANLNEQRRLAEKLMRAIDHSRPLDHHDVRLLVELVIALDEWISQGGFAPRDWKTKL